MLINCLIRRSFFASCSLVRVKEKECICVYDMIRGIELKSAVTR
jgi:hypothetical protein